jgi:hypothetical protein
VPLNKHLRKEWRDAKYPDGMGSAAVCSPPRAGYRRVYHITSAEYAISNVVLGRLKVARFTDMNDPFELLAPKAAAKNVDLEVFRKQFSNENGLHCFSSDWTDPVLWSHYGAKHRGICLGFNVAEHLLRHVRYETDRLIVNVAGGSISNKLADQILETKFESWGYEDEWRVLVPLKNATKEGRLHFTYFDNEIELAEVILGALCDIGAKRMRKMVAKVHKDIVVFKARLAHNSFLIVPDERTVLKS